MEAEYIAACEAAKESLWIKKFYTDIKVIPDMDWLLALYCNNRGELINSKKSWSHKRGKHIEMKYHLIREIVYRWDINIVKIASKDNLMHSFTKTLSERAFNKHFLGIGLKDMIHLL